MIGGGDSLGSPPFFVAIRASEVSTGQGSGGAFALECVFVRFCVHARLERIVHFAYFQSICQQALINLP